MEEFRNTAAAIQRQTDATNGLSKSMTSSRALELASPDAVQEYREAMLLVVHDSFEASSQNPTLKEEMARAKVWTELLFDIVPIDRLGDAFRRAFCDKSDSFPVNAYEIKNAWQKIQTEEDAERDRQFNEAQSASAIETCVNRHNHVDDGRAKASDGLTAMYNPADNSERLVPCPNCRPKAFAQRHAEYIESKKGAGPPPAVTSAVDEVIRSQRTVKPVEDDGRELLGWCSKEFIQEYLAAKRDEFGIRRFKYQLFGRLWAVRWDEGECQRIGVVIHHASDYIKLGPKGYAKLNGITLAEEQ